MRFQAKMTKGESVQTFLKVLESVGQYSKDIVIKITPQHFVIIAPQFHTRGRLILYIELHEVAMFQDYIMRGLVANDAANPQLNAIFLEADTRMMLDVFQAYNEHSSAVSITLLPRPQDAEDNLNRPVLCFEFENSSSGGELRLVKHDVNVSLISKRKWSEYDEPVPDNVQVNVRLPSAHMFTKVVYKMKWFSHLIRFTGETTGTLAVRGERSGSAVTTTMASLQVLTPVERDASGRIPPENHRKGSCKVEAAIMYDLLNMFVQEHSVIDLHVQEEKRIGFLIKNHDHTVMCVLPSLLS